MKMTIFGPSPEYRNYAGPKIRYHRIMPLLAKLGIDLEIRDIADLNPRTADSDVVLISKCHDSRALVSAAILADRGVHVGVDIFDDYFSQESDSRLARYRTWLDQLLPICDFALCSTPALAKVIEAYRSDIPTLVMNDPGPPIDLAELKRALEAKSAEARESCRLRIAWFGVGDSPYFRVGLHDLAAFGGSLQSLRRCGMDLELRILTNARALTADGLARIRELPVRTSVDEWTEEREKALLEDSLLAFLPVNGSQFSAGKSLNRAVTALAAGCQVLSVGHPLYAPLEPFIYRDPAEMADDLNTQALRLRPETLGAFQAAIDTHASAETEAARLVSFLSGLKPMVPANRPLALVHGHSTNGLAHKLVQAAGGLSVASPACSAPLGFDLIFRDGTDHLTMLVSAKARRRLPPEDQERFRPAGAIDSRKFFAIGDDSSNEAAPAAALPAKASLAYQLATYSASTGEIADQVRHIFGDCHVIVSETSPLPFRPAV